MGVLDAAAELRDALAETAPAGRAAYVYHPLDYAWRVHEAFARKYGRGRKRILFVGMNPGPWGMTQSGVPLADAIRARTWMGLDGVVRAPPRTHPKRPVLGLACPRRDVTGERFYAWAEARWGGADAFFSEAYVANHCPLYFADAEGRNVPPAQVPRAMRDAITPACDAHLAAIAEALRPHRIAALGAYAAKAALRALGDAVPIVPLPHPSPASPENNAGWGPRADAALDALPQPF